jgi:hypothetical protein
MKDVKSLKGVVLVVLVALMTVSVGAQRADAPMSAARSYALQRQLQTIDQHRAEFVQQLLADWTPYVDVNAYNLQEELAPIAMKVPAWQLYGASLVGDFRTMVRVLKGQVGAGRFINAFAEPQPKSFMDGSVPGPDVFGDYNNNLVFTPIPPCRLVDTRNSGARTGPLLPGIPRSFDLTTTAFSKGQGGVVLLSDCPTLPSFSNLAWAVNVTVTGYGGLGDLRAWPYLGTLPLASIINYGTGTAAIANGLTLTGCYGCADDITVVADAVATHLIIDVTGYYEQAGLATSTMTRVAGTSTPIANGSFAFVNGGACPSGTLLVGGEVDHDAGDLAVGESRMGTSTIWTFWMINNAGYTGNVVAYSRCVDTPIRY